MTGATWCAIRTVCDAVLAVTLAPRCVACAQTLDAPLDGPVCAPCWLSIRPIPAPLCTRCGDSLPSWRVLSAELERCARCRRAPPAIDCGRSAGDYTGALREIIHAFKYEKRRTLAGRLGGMMCRAGGPLLADADCVVPVPLHPWRHVHRGFNQAADLAATLGRPAVHALVRRRATAPQAGLAATARRRNVRSAFQLSPLLSSRARAEYVSGRVVVLVDDITTTGATLDACARVLKEAGAREVRALTAARATLVRTLNL